MIISADDYTTGDDITTALTYAIKDLNDGDTLSFGNKKYSLYKDYAQYRNIHMTNTDSFKNPLKYFAVLLENKNNITVDGNGAVLVVNGDICALGILNCKNIKLKNFTVSYASPADVELKVVKTAGRKVTYEIPPSTYWYIDGRDVVFFSQSPFTKKNYWLFKNDENSWNGACHTEDNDVFRVAHKQTPFSYVKSVKRKSQVLLEIEYIFKRKFTVGDVYAFSQNKNRNTCGIFVNESSDISAENIEVNYLQGFGWLSQMCENVSFDNVIFKPDSEHNVSSFADLIHICGCKGNVKISNCYFAHPHDDAINIHGTFLRVKDRIDDYTAVFEFVHNQQGGYRAFNNSDKVEFYFRNTLNPLDGVYTVKSAEDDIQNKTVTVSFNEKLPDCLMQKLKGQNNVVAENISYCPNVEISNCEFTAIPTRGILCTTSGKVRIHDNNFSHIAMAHIFISNDAADWYESGPVRDVEIFSNTFRLTSSKRFNYKDSPAVLIKPITYGNRPGENIHKNIRIHSNTFFLGRERAVTAYAVNGISVHNNTYEPTAQSDPVKCINCKEL